MPCDCKVDSAASKPGKKGWRGAVVAFASPSEAVHSTSEFADPTAAVKRGKVLAGRHNSQAKQSEGGLAAQSDALG